MKAPIGKDYLVFGITQLLGSEIEEVLATLRSAWIVTGPRVARFEEAFRGYAGSSMQSQSSM
jgi:dTDP-4-amino-4,6-dideoxygalactose transaminase